VLLIRKTIRLIAIPFLSLFNRQKVYHGCPVIVYPMFLAEAGRVLILKKKGVSLILGGGKLKQDVKP
jgi:hypothetical protein